MRVLGWGWRYGEFDFAARQCARRVLIRIFAAYDALNAVWQTYHCGCNKLCGYRDRLVRHCEAVIAGFVAFQA